MNNHDTVLERSRRLRRAQVLSPDGFFEELVEMDWFERVEKDVFKVTAMGLQELYHMDYSGAGWYEE